MKKDVNDRDSALIATLRARIDRQTEEIWELRRVVVKQAAEMERLRAVARERERA